MGWTLQGLDEAIASLEAQLAPSLEDGMRQAVEVVAASARTNHPYQNRTGRLERRTRAGRVRGTIARGIRGEVVGGTEYGGFVEYGTSRARAYPYLAPAYAREEPQVVTIFSSALASAVTLSGWSE